MKKTLYIFLSTLFIISIFSCTKDSGLVEVTYQEATAIYGDLEAYRTLEPNQAPRAIDNPGKIYIADDYILIGEEGEGIHVIDNTDRNNPVATSFIQLPGNREYFVEGNFLYAESLYDVVKVDIANPNQVVIQDRAEFAIQDAFINDQGETLIGFSYEEKTTTLDENDDFYNEIVNNQIVYIDYAKNTIPKSAVPASFAGNSSSQSGTVNRVTKLGDYVYVISNQNMITINDNSFSTDFNRYENVKEGMETVFPYANHLFVGSRSSMSIYALSAPQQPEEVFEFDHATSCDPVLPYGNVAYVTLRTGDFSECPGQTNALVVIDIELLETTKEIQEIEMKSPYGMSVIDGLLYVGEGTNGLSVFDVSNPRDPQWMQTYPNIEAYDIIADPNNNEIVFIAGPNGLSQFGTSSSQGMDLRSNIDF